MKDTERVFSTRGSQCDGCDGLVSLVLNPISAKCSVTPECSAGVQGSWALSSVLLECMRVVKKKCFVSLGSLMGVTAKKKLYQSVAGPLGEKLHHFVGRSNEQRKWDGQCG